MTLREVVALTFYINGYIVLYVAATVFASFIGYAAALIDKNILQRILGARLIPHRDELEFARGVCVLTCGTGFLIVAVGLLFMHLVGGLPHEYDELAAQVGIAVFGVLVFACVCLTVAMVVVGMFWVVWICRGKGGQAEWVDEETCLLKRSGSRLYGSGEASTAREDRRRAVEAILEADETAVEEEAEEEPACPNPTWIKMRLLSSIRELDFRRMRYSSR